MIEPSALDPAWLLPALYAEVHYRHGRIPSLLYRPFPEVIADVPLRVEPGWEGDRLPVLVLVKDAHRYPVRVEAVKIDLRAARGRRVGFELGNLNWTCREPMQHRIFFVELGPLARRGALAVAVEVCLRELGGRHRGRRVRVRGDSYGRWPTLLHTRAAAEALPEEPGWAAGDLHHHTHFTNDQVEFGAPLEVSAIFAAAAGCRWAATTDHSFDLDDDPDDFLVNRPDLPKWRMLHEQARRLNEAGAGAWLLPGEELSCGGAGGHNLHLLVLGHRRFLPGVGDGAELWFHNGPTFPLPEVLRRTASKGAVAYAAHPFDPLSRANRLGFNRALWTESDCATPGLGGLQIWNGVARKSLRGGLPRWIELLDQGHRLPIGAGNDAHGNFALGRSIALPFISLSLGTEQVYARARTTLGLRGPLGDEALLDALRAGRSFVSNGPSLRLQAVQQGKVLDPGDFLRPDFPARLRLRGRSTEELGRPESLLLRMGAPRRGEAVVASASGGARSTEIALELSLEAPPDGGWIRAELRCETPPGGDEAGCALSSPIWVGGDRSLSADPARPAPGAAARLD